MRRLFFRFTQRSQRLLLRGVWVTAWFHPWAVHWDTYSLRPRIWVKGSWQWGYQLWHPQAKLQLRVRGNGYPWYISSQGGRAMARNTDPSWVFSSAAFSARGFLQDGKRPS
jgi:hypothetical protein